MKKYIISVILGLFIFVACSEKVETVVKPTVVTKSVLKKVKVIPNLKKKSMVKTSPKQEEIKEFIPEHIRLSHIEVVSHY